MKDLNIIPAGKFKATCLKLMDDVVQFRKSLIITKHGKPVARLLPYEEEEINLFGALEGLVKINKDIVSPLDIEWQNDDGNL